MSDKEEKKDKVVTRYDRKMQRRQAEKEKEQKQKKIGVAVGIVIAAALAAWIVSFPIRNYMAVHGTFITVNGEKVTRAEFDYNYNNVVNNYVGQYGAYLGYFGLDTSQDFADQMYSDTLSWKDYFEEMTVDSMKRSKVLKAEADAAGFTFDASEEVAEFKDTLKESAKSENMSMGKYIRRVYGSYASIKRISGYIEESARINAYFDQLSEGMEPSDEEILEYYNENKDSYDSVDYYMSAFDAELPDEPTDDEIDTALANARELAEAAETDIMSEGEEQTNVTMDSAPSAISDWLFDEARKEGDTAVIEDDSDYTYYTLGFVQRRREEVPRASVRVIMSQDLDGQAVLDEWAGGEATEDSFAELANKYSADNGEVVNGGLYEEVTPDTLSDDISEWIFAEGRKSGDTGFVTTEEGYTYVMYYVSQLDPEWKQDIRETLISQAQEDYIEALVENVTVEDPKNHLNYLKVRAEEAAVSDGDVSGDDMAGEDVSGGDVSDGNVSGGDES